jgi:hypothetical protein
MQITLPGLSTQLVMIGAEGECRLWARYLIFRERHRDGLAPQVSQMVEVV